MLNAEWPYLFGEPVFAKHRKVCKEKGHVTGWIRDGVETGECARCGEKIDPRGETEFRLEDLL